MKFNLNQLKKDAYNGPFLFEKSVDMSKLKKLNKEIREIKFINVKGQCDLREVEVIFTLTISGEMILPCARTLVDVPFSFEINEVETFSESPYFGEEEEENEIHPIVGEIIDLTPQIQENVLLAVPFRVFSEDKKTLKSSLQKGEGWEYVLEEEYDERQKETIDPRLKKLQTLLEDKQD